VRTGTPAIHIADEIDLVAGVVEDDLDGFFCGEVVGGVLVIR
jgi:hypothetical protein